MPNQFVAGSRSGGDSTEGHGAGAADLLSLALTVFERAGELRHTIRESFPQVWRCARAVSSEWQLALRLPGRRAAREKPLPRERSANPRPRGQSPDLIRTDGRPQQNAPDPLVIAGVVLAVDPLLRMLIALAGAVHSEQTEPGRCPLADDLIDRHRTTRDLALQALLHAPPLQWNTVRQLDRDRRQLERWSDLLLATSPVAEHAAGLAFCADTYQQFQKSDSGLLDIPEQPGAVRQQLMVARLAALRLQSGGLLGDSATETAGLRGLQSCVRECLALASRGTLTVSPADSSPQTADISPWLPVATPGLREEESPEDGAKATARVRPPESKPEKRSRISWSRLGRGLPEWPDPEKR